MRRVLFAVACVLGLWAQPAHAAVAYGTTVNVTPGTGTNTGASPSITSSASNPVVVVSVVIYDNLGGTTITGLTITGFGGTATMISRDTLVGTADQVNEIWCIVAPTANTAGTVQANFSASVPFAMAVTTYSGADQTTPCPSGAGNVVADHTNTDPRTLDPANAASGEVTHGSASNILSQDLDTITPNSVYAVNATNDMAVGYAVDGTGVTFGVTSTEAYSTNTIRIVAAAGGGGGATCTGALLLLGAGGC